MNIRNYKKEDLNLILKWYRDHKQFEPFANMLLTDSTFILEHDNKPVMCISVYLTNSKEIALLEHLVRDPEFNGSIKDEAIKMITNYAENFTKNMGYSRLVTLINRKSLKDKYLNYGYIENGKDLSIFVKDLE